MAPGILTIETIDYVPLRFYRVPDDALTESERSINDAGVLTPAGQTTRPTYFCTLVSLSPYATCSASLSTKTKGGSIQPEPGVRKGN